MMSGMAVASPPSSGGLERHVTMATGTPIQHGIVNHAGHPLRAPSGSRPKSRGSSANDRLTPMPGYMKPIVKSAVRKWKKLHEDHMMNKLMDKRYERKDLNQVTREDAHRLAKKIPMEVLAKDWFRDTKATVETRAFLVDKVLPTLIIGCEKLLMEVDRRGLADLDTTEPSFNPINFLAQYLMRNNPRYSNFSEASPYVRGLRDISEELKKQLFDIDENRLARIKVDARRRREDREKAEQMKIMEKKRREDLLRKQFNEWNIGYHPNGRVELALLQNALRLFSEVAEQFPEELRSAAQYSQEIGQTDDTGKMLAMKEFVMYVTGFVEGMPSEIFDQFLLHMNRCATAYRAQSERESRRVALSQLFMSCDNAGVGLLDRHRILNLFEMFWDKAKVTTRVGLRNPREWPVVDIQEVQSFYGDSDQEDESDPEVKDALEVADPDKTPEATPTEESTAEATEETNVIPGEDTQEEKPAGDMPEVTPEEGEKVAEVGDTNPTSAGQESKECSADNAKSEKDSADLEGEEKTDKPEIPEDQKVDKETDSVSELGEDKTKESKDPGKEITENKLPREYPSDTEGEPTVEGAAEPAGGDTVLPPEGVSDTLDRLAEQSTEKADGVQRESEKGSDDEAITDKERCANDQLEKEKDESDASNRGVESARVEPATKASEDERDPELAKLLDRDETNLSQHTANTAERPPMTQQSKVSFAEGTNFLRDRTLIQSRTSRCHSVASAFDENTLNVSQFVHMIETFLGDVPLMEAFHQLVRFVKTGYMETEEERMQRLFKARQEAQESKRKAVLNSLFEMWDNDGSGNLDFEEVETVMKKYKEGQEKEAINTAKKEFRKKTRNHDSRLSKREFREFVHRVVEKMSGQDAFDYFVDFMLNSVERSYAERVRGEARKKWLQQIINTAETSGANLDPVYKTIFQSLYRDAETHGNNKVISAHIAMLERNDVAPGRGDFMLRYVAATPDDAPYLLGKALFKDMKGISFASVGSGKPIHVPRVSNHGNIHFWNPERDEVDGSFIIIPLKDRNKRVFGLLGIDTLCDPHSRALFITHEIQFFQGIAKAFSIAYHHVDVRQKTMRISESAVSWIHRRSPSVHEIIVYMVEPDGKGQDYVLRKMMTTNHKGNTGLKKCPPRLERRDNLFRDYLFKCVDNSESITADAYGERHLAIPLRDDEGLAIVVIDISIGDLKALPRNESHEVTKMLKLLQMAYKQISQESKEGERTMLLEVERELGIKECGWVRTSLQSQEGDKLDDDSRTEILFDRLMLLELRENVSKLDPKAYAELKSYVDPPRVVHMIVKAVLSIFYPDKAREGEFDNWAQCKQYVTPQLSQLIMVYDPTSDVSNDNVPVDMIHTDLEEVPHGQVCKHGSIPAQYLYNWVFVCISLIEHSRKMHNSSRSNILTEIPPPAKKRETTNMTNDAQQTLPADQTMLSLVES